jgi:hypothetical protein
VSIEDDFADFHRDNPHVYVRLRALALRLKDRGRPFYGIKALTEIVRFEQAMETTDPDYKINNNYTALYARMLMDLEPELRDFFRTRRASYDVAAE